MYTGGTLAVGTADGDYRAVDPVDRERTCHPRDPLETHVDGLRVY